MSPIPDVAIRPGEGDCMTRAVPPVPSIILAIISDQYLVWFGLQKMFERIKTPRIVVHPHQRVTPDLFLAEKRPDVFLLDLETHQDAAAEPNAMNRWAGIWERCPSRRSTPEHSILFGRTL